MIAGWPVVMVCVYMMDRSWSDDVFGVARTHQFALARRRGAWDFLGTVHSEKTKEEIEILNGDVDQLPAVPEASLTERERVVLGQIVKGASSKTAARKLGISPRTVEYHRANAMQKLGAKNTADLVRMLMTAR